MNNVSTHKLFNRSIVAPQPQSLQGFEGKYQECDTEQNTCPKCGAIAQHNITVQPPQSPHYGCLRCAECDRFIKWLENPENRQKRERRSRLIQTLLSNPKLSLNDWERRFLSNISTAKKISPDQQAWLDRIYSRLGDAV